MPNKPDFDALRKQIHDACTANNRDDRTRLEAVLLKLLDNDEALEAQLKDIAGF